MPPDSAAQPATRREGARRNGADAGTYAPAALRPDPVPAPARSPENEPDPAPRNGRGRRHAATGPNGADPNGQVPYSAGPGAGPNGATTNGAAADGRATNGRAARGAAHNGTARNGTARNGTARDGAAPNGAIQNGAAHNGADHPGVGHSDDGRNGSGRPGATRNGVSRNGVTRNGAGPIDAGPAAAGPIGTGPHGIGPNAAGSHRTGPNGAGATGTGPHGATGQRAGGGQARNGVPPRRAAPPTNAVAAENPPAAADASGVPVEQRPAADRPTRRPGPPAAGGAAGPRRGRPAAADAAADANPTTRVPAVPRRSRAGQATGSVDDPQATGLIRPEPPAPVPIAERRPGRDDIGSGVPDVSERAERTRRDERTVATSRALRIDETLTRLTAAHAGLSLPRRDGTEADDEADDDSTGTASGPPRQRHPGRTAGRLLALVLTVLVAGSTTFGWAAERWLGAGVRDVAALDPGSGAIVDADAQRGDQNVLVVATDAGTAAPGTQAGMAANAETALVAHVPAGGGPVVVMSIPTDLEINRPPCERFDPVAATYSDETVPAEARTQLTSALDVGGPRCATRVVQQLTGLAITTYVGVDLDRLGAAVDAVSGVDVCVPRPVLDTVLGPVVPQAGNVELDGRRAGDFVRAADVTGDPPSGLGRIERQQQVLSSVLTTALSSTGLLNVGQLSRLRPALAGALVTDGAGLDQVLALSMSLRELDADGVTFTSVPTASDANGRGNAVLRDADAAALFAAIRDHEPLPAGADDPSTDSGPAPGDVTVQLFNASDRSGLASKVGDTLRALGFGVGEVSNADQPTPQTVIRFSPDQAAAAGLLATTVPSATSVPDPGTSGVLQLVLGRSFDDVVRAPAEPVALQSPDPGTPQAGAVDCS